MKDRDGDQGRVPRGVSKPSEDGVSKMKRGSGNMVMEVNAFHIRMRTQVQIPRPQAKTCSFNPSTLQKEVETGEFRKLVGQLTQHMLW